MDKVLICGLGALGMTYASKFNNSQNCELRILVDSKRYDKYKKSSQTFNGKALDLSFILPDSDFKADLIIISTKYSGLNSAIYNIKNFINKNTIIISLLNGITSEEEIRKAYPHTTILKSYFIGHSAVRTNNSVTQDGVGKIYAEKNKTLEEIFKRNNIDYSMPDDIDYSMWLKFTMNIFSNQTSAILEMTFGELKKNKEFIKFSKKIIKEVKEVGEISGINNLENLENDALHALSQMCDDGLTSMHQDILAHRKTEVEIFAGEIIKLGQKYGIETPYNQVLYDLIKIKENNYGTN